MASAKKSLKLEKKLAFSVTITWVKVIAVVTKIGMSMATVTNLLLIFLLKVKGQGHLILVQIETIYS